MAHSPEYLAWTAKIAEAESAGLPKPLCQYESEITIPLIIKVKTEGDTARIAEAMAKEIARRLVLPANAVGAWVSKTELVMPKD